jgi:nicotinamide-nucleotide amidase
VTRAHVLTVQDGCADDRAAREVARALAAEGALVDSRHVVDASEAALEPALRGALEAGGLTVVLCEPGGSAGELVPRVMARITGARLVLNERRLALLESSFARRGQAMPRRLDRQALLPKGALLLPSATDGWSLARRNGVVVVLPLSSPHLGSVLSDFLNGPTGLKGSTGRPAEEAVVQRVLLTTGLSAADAEERVGSWLGKEGDVTVVCMPVDGDVHVRLVARGATHALAEAALAPVEAEVRAALGADCYGQDDELLEAVVGRLLLERGWTVSLAESCTGGLLGNRLTNVAGSSRYVERGVIVYSNRAKEELLGVPEPLLRAHGAVSAPVALAMAEGVCRSSGSACGLAVTGIAGPDGGSAEKPVGTVYVGCATPAGVETRRCLFAGDRVAVKWQSSQTALDMLRRRLLG